VTYLYLAQILAPCQANISTNQFKCVENRCLVGLVDLRARHSAKIRATNWYFVGFKAVRARTVPVI
jgi:hypothetical protein